MHFPWKQKLSFANLSMLGNQMLPLPANRIPPEDEHFAVLSWCFAEVYAHDLLRKHSLMGNHSGLQGTLELVRYWEAALQGAWLGGGGSGGEDLE